MTWTSEAGRVPSWLPLALLFLCLLGGLRWLEADARGRGLAQVDVTRYALETEAPWVNEEWFEDLEELLLEAEEVAADDEEAIASLAARVRALPFIAEVGAPRARLRATAPAPRSPEATARLPAPRGFPLRDEWFFKGF